MVPIAWGAVSGLSVTNRKGSFELEKSDGKWNVKSPAPPPAGLDAEKVDALGRSLCALSLDQPVAPVDDPAQGFDDPEAASDFFQGAPVAYTATPNSCTFVGVELTTDGWDLRPLHVDAIKSSFFDDPTRFPPGAAALDSAFLMAGLATTWQPGNLLTPTQTSGRQPCGSA